MEKFISNEVFDQLKSNLNEFVIIMNNVKKTTDLDPKIINILNSCNKQVSGSDEYILLHYETLYDKLSDFQIKKDEEIKKCQDNFNMIKDIVKRINESSKFIKQITTTEQIFEIINKEIIFSDKIKVTTNDLVDKIIERKKIIFNKKINDLENRMQQTCDKLDETYFKNKEIVELIPSINKLKE